MKKVLLLAAVTAVAALTAGIATTTATKTTARAAEHWAPGIHEPWQWMISGTFDPNNATDLRGGAGDQPTVYDIDGFLNSAATVQTLHSRGYHVICYIEVGSWTDFRPDVALFPSVLIGRQIEGFSDRWTDIRSPLLRPIIESRIKMCASKGFDAVEPDLEDGYSNDTGFPITAQDQITFNTWVAQTVHANGMSVLLKGDPEQAKQLASTVDFFLNEECNAYGECASYPAGMTVLNAEYSGKCPTSDYSLTNLDTTLFKVDLDGSRTPCANSKGGGTTQPSQPTVPTSSSTSTTTTSTVPKPTTPFDPTPPGQGGPRQTTTTSTSTTTTTTQPPKATTTTTTQPSAPSSNNPSRPRRNKPSHRHPRGRSN